MHLRLWTAAIWLVVAAYSTAIHAAENCGIQFKQCKVVNNEPYTQYCLLCDPLNQTYYQSSQIDTPTGETWCVNPVTGLTITNTKRMAIGERIPCTCDSMRQLGNKDGEEAYCSNKPCIQKLNETCPSGIVRSGNIYIGKYCVQCDPINSELYGAVQSTAWISWCVDVVTGEKIGGTERVYSRSRQLDCSCSEMLYVNNSGGIAAYCSPDNIPQLNNGNQVEILTRLWLSLPVLMVLIF